MTSRRETPVDLDLRAEEFAGLTVAALLRFAERFGCELVIEFRPTKNWKATP